MNKINYLNEKKSQLIYLNCKFSKTSNKYSDNSISYKCTTK